MNPLVSGEGNTTVGTTEPGSTTKQPDPVTEDPKSTTGSSSQGDQTMFYYQIYIYNPGVDCGGTRGSATSCDECICYEQGEIDGKPLLSCGSRGDCGGDCQWSGGSNGMCVRKQGNSYSEVYIVVYNVVYNLHIFIFTTSGDGNSTKEPGIDPGLTEKPDPATEEPQPTTGSTSQGEKGAYERASHSV